MFKLILIFAFACLVIWLAPLACIWSVNTLFATTIPYTFDTWVSAFILSSVVSGQGILSFKAR
jgi:hypothetical protein